MRSLVERMELLVSREELQGVRNDLVANAQNIVHLRQSPDNLAAHIYQVFQPVTLDNSILLTSQFFTRCTFCTLNFLCPCDLSSLFLQAQLQCLIQRGTLRELLHQALPRPV